MVAALDNFSVFKHHNRMTVADGGKPVRYYENRPALHKLIHTLLYELFRTGIDGRSCFVQNDNGAIRNHRARYGEKLSLPLRKIGSVALYNRFISLGQVGNNCLLYTSDAADEYFFV